MRGIGARQRQADAWNTKHAEGARVRYWPISEIDGSLLGPGNPYTTRSIAFVSESGEPVIFLEGKAGYVALSHVRAEP